MNHFVPFAPPPGTGKMTANPHEEPEEELPFRPPPVAPCKRLLKDIPSNEFSSKVELFRGPDIKILVGGAEDQKTFTVPKALISYYSKYFEAMFNGPWGESKQLKTQLPENPPDAFEMAVQWMYSGQIVLSEVPDVTNITRFLDFFILADRIDLLGPLDTVLHQVKMILRASYLALQPPHVRKAVRFLPSGHALRKLFAESCVQAYLSHTQPAGKGRFREWHFENEVDDLESFASDLLKAVGETGRSRSTATGGIVVRDAVTNKTFTYY